MEVPDYRRFTFAVKLNREERDALRALSRAERLPMSQVVRRLIWKAAKATERDARGGLAHAR